MTEARIVALAEAAGWIEPLAVAHHVAWCDLFGPHWNLEVVRAELRDSQHAGELPATWIAVQGDTLIGSVSLLQEDAPELQHHGAPWLGNLWVDPTQRGRGWGRRLVLHAVAAASAWQIPRLLLFTPEHAAYYQGMGWRPLATDTLAGRSVEVMFCDPLVLARVVA